MYRKEIFMYIVMVSIFTMVSVIVGMKFENGRIYDKCMSNNNNLVRAEAITICKKIVR
jgi:exosome complex RNA-binding protein Rrp4